MMEWLDSLWAWIISLLASILSLFTSVEKSPVMDPLGLVASESVVESVSSNASNVSDVLEAFAAQAAQVPPIVVDLSDNAPPNM